MKIEAKDGLIQLTPECGWDCFTLGEISAKAKLPQFSISSSSWNDGKRDVMYMHIKQAVLIDFLADRKKEEPPE